MMIPLLVYFIAVEVAICLFVFYTVIKGNGELPWWEKVFLLALFFDYAAELVHAVSRLGLMLEKVGMAAVAFSGWVRVFSVTVFAIVLVVRTRGWIVMRRRQ